MVKIVIDAGHGYNTAGKRSPDGEREWSFNNKVAVACIEELRKYSGVEILRVDDATGKTDVPLRTRTDKANKWRADIYVSIHHNANTAKWGTWTGVETFVYPTASANSHRLAKAVHSKIVKAYGLRDRGIKKANFHVVRETKMPAILVEGGFMDSLIDIKKLRSEAVLKQAGRAIAQGIVEYFGLKLKAPVEPARPVKNTVSNASQKSNNIPKGTKLLTVKANSLYTYNSPNWNDKGLIVKKGDVYTVVDELTVNGYKMYKIKSGRYITANTKYVSVRTVTK